jgi:dTDP-L-rhamnose 4-epimerase
LARVLITGGAGFIGSHTATALRDLGHFVRILDSLEPDVHGLNPIQYRSQNGLEFIRGDVRDPCAVARAIDGIDVIYHFAALTGVAQSMSEHPRYTDVNCAGTSVLLRALLASKSRLYRFVLASSRAVYGEGTYSCHNCGVVDPPQRLEMALAEGEFQVFCPHCGTSVTPRPTCEDKCRAPVSVYGWTKREQEDLCQSYARSHDLPLVCLRYFNVFGSNQSLRNRHTGIVPIFYLRIRSRQPIDLYECGLPIRDFVHISDVVRANLLALSADLPPGICLNIGTGREISIAHLAERLFVASGLRGNGKSNDFRVTREFRLGDVRSCYADVSFSRRVLGFESRVDVDAGLSEFVRWAEASGLAGNFSSEMDFGNRYVLDSGRND